VIRRLLLVAATVLGFVAFVPAGPAQAIPACKAGFACLYQFWADSEHTVFNGFRSVDCNRQVTTSGKLTGFLEFSQGQCG
jgi:hypothetical protein